MTHPNRTRQVAMILTMACAATTGETLHNGIVLPSAWPPRDQHVSVQPTGAHTWFLLRR